VGTPKYVTELQGQYQAAQAEIRNLQDELGVLDERITKLEAMTPSIAVIPHQMGDALSAQGRVENLEAWAGQITARINEHMATLREHGTALDAVRTYAKKFRIVV
tara:strand:- start:106 stop:420 length:315 start_codon:yes stop_codon:yes gene_type:complete